MISIALYLAFVAIPKNTERLEQSIQEIDRITAELIDVCMNPQSASDIEVCDKQIPEIIENCKNRHIEACDDPRLLEYSAMRTELIEKAGAKLNSYALNLIEACSNMQRYQMELVYEYGFPIPEEIKGTMSDINDSIKEYSEKMSEIKIECEKLRGTENYFEACDNPWISGSP